MKSNYLAVILSAVLLAACGGGGGGGGGGGPQFDVLSPSQRAVLIVVQVHHAE